MSTSVNHPLSSLHQTQIIVDDAQQSEPQYQAPTIIRHPSPSKKPLPPIPSKKPLPQQPILNRSDTIELEESVTPKEDFEDIAVFRDCYIKLDICKIYGVLCLSQVWINILLTHK